MIDMREALSGEEKAPDWLVEDMFHCGQMVCQAGAPGVGKSFLSIHLAFCIAHGLPFLGRKVKKGRVLYFDEENSRPDAFSYLRTIWRGMGSPDLETSINSFAYEHFRVCGQMDRFSYMTQRAAQVQPSLIIIDTATTVCGIQDENDNAEASRMIAKLRSVRAACTEEPTMVILKHEKFSHDPLADRTIRGAKTWLGEVDMVIYHTRVPGRTPKNGLRPSLLRPDKVRAFGLKQAIKIIPAQVSGGIALSGEISEA